MPTIRVDDLAGQPTRDLLRLHLAAMQAHSPPDAVHALDAGGLSGPDVTVWTAWSGEQITGIAALRDLGGGEGEVKSTRTHPDHLRRGVAAALLDHLIAQARARGMVRLSLETGHGAAFEPAVALYRTRGLKPGGAFGDYRPGGFSRFLHLKLL